MVKINVKITGFEVGRTEILLEPNSMWEDDVVTTSSRIHYEVDGCKCGTFTNSNNVEEAIGEIIPKIILDEFLEHSFRFEDLDLPNPEYETYDDGNGFVEYVNEFLNLRNCEVSLIDEEVVVGNLIDKGLELFEVVVE